MRNSLERIQDDYKKYLSYFFVISDLIFLLNICYSSTGILTKFVDVVLENVEIGRSYNLRELKNCPYVITNAGDQTTEVIVEIEAPLKSSLMEGYEPIPDVNWLKIIPSNFKLGPNQNGFADVILQVEDKPEYVGKHFQATIYAHTKSGDMLQAGVRSRIRFSTGKGPESLKAEKKRKKMLTLDYEMTPNTVNIYDVEIGRKYDTKKEKRTSLKITNRADEPVRLKIKSVPVEQRMSLLPGFEPAPKPEWLILKPEKVKVKGNVIEEVQMYFNFPNDETLKGKKFAFIVKTELEGEEVPIDTYSRVYVTIKK